MANSTRRYPMMGPEAGQDVLTLSFNVGATGAVGSLNPSTRAKGFVSPYANRTGVGTYDILLKEKWIDLLWYVVNCNGPVSAVSGKNGEVVSDALTAATPKVTVTFVNASGAAADPANGDQVYFTFALKRRSPL